MIPTRPSPRRQFELFVESAIEAYKEHLARSEIMAIGDEAASAVMALPDAMLTELVVWEEVDRIIFNRLRLPSYAVWRRKNNLSQERTDTLLDAAGRPVSSKAKSQAVLLTAHEVSSDLISALNRDPAQLHKLTPRQFEHVVAELLARDGFAVEVTPATRDGGKDVIAKMRTAAGCFIVFVECKRYAPDRPVGVSIARELIGVLHTDRATSGLLVTTSSFSPEVYRLREAIPHRLDLKAYNDLVIWLNRAQSPKV